MSMGLIVHNMLDSTLFQFHDTPMKGKFSDYYTKEYKSGSLIEITYLHHDYTNQ